MIPEKDRLTYIDALRGLAIIGVMMVHVHQQSSNNFPAVLEVIQDKGAMGVQLFFIVSAFTIFLTTQKLSFTNRNDVMSFYVKRTFRIAPLFFLSIIFYQFEKFSNLFTTGEFDVLWLSQIVSHLLLINDFNPYWINTVVSGGWSIGVEVTFYLTIPFLAQKITSFNKALNFSIITLILCTVIIKILYRLPIDTNPSWYWDQFLYYSFISQLPIFSFGILAYFIVIKNDYQANPKILLIASLLLIIQFTITNIFPPHYWFGIGFLILLIALSQYPSSLLVNTLSQYLGKISYSLYLIHFAVVAFIEQHIQLKIFDANTFLGDFPNYLIDLLMVIVCSSIIATLTYYVIEVPFQKMGKEISNKITRRPAFNSTS